MDASDILENKVSQLQSLLSCCYGDGGEWFEVIGARHRDNIMWIASDLADEVGRLSQEILKGTNSISSETPKRCARSQKKPMSDAALAAFEASQDIEALLVQSAREMGTRKTHTVYVPVVAATCGRSCEGQIEAD
ncbi:hypothetical protein [Variovorax sp. CCNWLW235]|uniref:hypothetical protein n=1 Tax=Variovorax sp. CCNWLW235 TaxID=3127463 RepID=UPI0030789A32